VARGAAPGALGAAVVLLLVVALTRLPGAAAPVPRTRSDVPADRVEVADVLAPAVRPAPPTPRRTPAPPVVVPYRVEVRSADPSLATAAAEISAVLEDPRGWQQAGFDLVLDPAAPHVVAIAEAADAQALCEPYDVGGRFSCQDGPLVVLHADRWREAVPHWPGTLAEYRTMLVNHEVGHLLGMHHLRCQGPGLVAPVMEQQSGSLRGCLANPWPTPVELRLAATHQFELAPPPRDVPFPP
jgi:hypothetical protein